MTNLTNKKTIKPSLKAFPLTWLWIIGITVVTYQVGVSEVTLHLFFIYWLPPVALLLLSVYGRSYVISEGVVTKINHITGQQESVDTNAAGRIQIKPIAFGYGHVNVTLAGGHTFKIKNIKLPSKSEVNWLERDVTVLGIYYPRSGKGQNDSEKT